MDLDSVLAESPIAPPPAITLQKQDGRFKRGRSGNPAGKPLGTRNRATILAENMLDNEAESLVRKLIELANSGDSAALRLCVDRLIPPRRDRPMRLKLPPLRTAADAARAMAAVIAALTRGELSASEAADVVTLVDRFVQIIDRGEFERRLAKLEEATSDAP